MMIFNHTNWQTRIAHTGFVTSIASYLFFWGLEILRPGFVARFFSVHIFLLFTIGFALWWSHTLETYTDHRTAQWWIAVFLGVFLSVLAWQTLSVFELGRGVVSLVVLFVPVLVLRLIKYK